MNQDGLGTGIDGRRAVLGDLDMPPAPRWRAPGADVPTEADQDTASRLAGGGLRRHVGGEGLGCGAEIDLDVLGNEDQTSPLVKVNPLPPRHWPWGQRDRRCAAWDGLEVGVVPGCPERRSDGGIHQAVGEPGRAQRSPESPSKEPGDVHLMAALPVHRAQLAVLAEPAAALVDRGDDAVGGSLGGGQSIRPR